MNKVIIVGGGAAGMLASVIAARNGCEVLLFEKNEKLGKKVYITGKGRCNVTNNCDPEELDYVIPGNDDAIRAVKLIVSKMADAVIEANQGATDEEYYEAETAVEAEEAVEE